MLRRTLTLFSDQFISILLFDWLARQDDPPLDLRDRPDWLASRWTGSQKGTSRRQSKPGKYRILYYVCCMLMFSTYLPRGDDLSDAPLATRGKIFQDQLRRWKLNDLTEGKVEIPPTEAGEAVLLRCPVMHLLRWRKKTRPMGVTSISTSRKVMRLGFHRPSWFWRIWPRVARGPSPVPKTQRQVMMYCFISHKINSQTTLSIVSPLCWDGSLKNVRYLPRILAVMGEKPSKNLQGP